MYDIYFMIEITAKKVKQRNKFAQKWIKMEKGKIEQIVRISHT